MHGQEGSEVSGTKTRLTLGETGFRADSAPVLELSHS